MKLVRTFALVAAYLLSLVPALAADAIYPEYKEGLMSGAANTNLTTCDIRAVLVDLADYTYSSLHDFLDDVPAAARVAVSSQLTTVTVADGTLDTDDFTWSSVTGDPSESVILYCHTGTDATARLILFLDTALTGFPVTPNSGDINFTVDAAGWFTL